MEPTLEEQLVGKTIAFARRKRKYYTIKGTDQPECTGIEISLARCYGSPEIFKHLVFFSNKGIIIHERTSFVEDDIHSRNLYTEYLASLNAEGFTLKNSFNQEWAARPERYPL